MTKPIDLILGAAPTRTQTLMPRTWDAISNSFAPEYWIVSVQPPAMIGGEAVQVRLTPEQFERYKTWRDNKVMIQIALPDLSPEMREMLMTGLSPEKQKTLFAPDTREMEEEEMIEVIVNRAMGILKRISRTPKLSRALLISEVTSIHRNVWRLRLYDLLAADDLDLIHDVMGIHNHLDIDAKGKLILKDCFVPRYVVQ